MHIAALAGDWDTLCKIGAEREKQAGRLPQSLTNIPSAQHAEVRALIEEILSRNNEISERALPWLEHSKALLHNFAQASSVPPAI